MAGNGCLPGTAHRFTGNITVGTGSAGSGFLQYRSSNPLPFGTATITVNAGGIFSADNGSTNPSTLSNNFILNGGTLGTQVPNMTYSGSISVTANSTIGHVSNGSGTIAVTSIISGSGGLTINGGSTVTLSNANTYSGPTSVAASTILTLIGTGTTGGIASVATVSISNQATLNLLVPGISAGQTLQITDSGTTPEVFLAAGVNDTIRYLVLSNGTSSFTLPPGTYGSTSSNAANDSAIVADGLSPNSYFSGTGILTVEVPEPGTSGSVVLLASVGLLARRRRHVPINVLTTYARVRAA